MAFVIYLMVEIIHFQVIKATHQLTIQQKGGYLKTLLFVCMSAIII